MSLRTTLLTDAFKNLSNTEARDSFQQTVVIAEDHTRYSYQGISLLSQELAVGLLGLFKQALADPAVPDANKYLLDAEFTSFKLGSLDGRTGGLDFAQEQRQEFINTWIGQMEAAAQQYATVGMTAEAAQATQAVEILTAIREIGVTHGQAWQLPEYGIEHEPTLEEIAAIRESIAADALFTWVDTKFNEARTKANAGELLTQAAIIEFLGAE